MVSSIIDAVKPLDEKIEASHVSLFSGAAPIQLTDEGYFIKDYGLKFLLQIEFLVTFWPLLKQLSLRN